MKNKKMFAAPLSFDGRIGRLEFLLSLIIVFVAVFAIIMDHFFYVNTDIENLVNSIKYPLFTLAIWFLLAQTIKRGHDFEPSSVPFRLIPLLLLKGDKKEDNDSNEDKAGTIQNTYVRFYLCLMLLYTCGVTTSIIKWINILTSIEQVNLTTMILHIVFKTIFFVGFILLLHYRKVGFYLVTCGGIYYSIDCIRNIISLKVLLLLSPITAIYGLIIDLLYLASFTILYKMLKKSSEWGKLANGLKGINRKSILTYFLVLELANYISYVFSRNF